MNDVGRHPTISSHELERSRAGRAAVRSATIAATFALAALSSSCTDPVRDQQIAALGPEPGGAPGPEHRPGQPCVLCHSAGGPASNAKFVVAGTVFESGGKDAKGASGVTVKFADGSGPRYEFETNAVGNFFAREDEWSRFQFPLIVGLQRGTAPGVAMRTTINREGSCNFCHKPNPDSQIAYPGTDDARDSIGPVIAPAAAQ